MPEPSAIYVTTPGTFLQDTAQYCQDFFELYGVLPSRLRVSPSLEVRNKTLALGVMQLSIEIDRRLPKGTVYLW